MTPAPNWDIEEKRAIAAVSAAIKGIPPNTGTAFYVGRGYAITALHVVADVSSGKPVFADKIDLSFKFANAQMPPTPASVVKDFWDLKGDWAVLLCQNPPPIKPIARGPLPDKGSAVEAYGCPNIQPEGFNLPAEVQDNHHSIEGAAVLDIYSEKGKNVPLYGLSGSPCFQAGKAVGILRAVLETEMIDGRMRPKLVTEAGVVYVCPSAAIVEWQEKNGREVLPDTWAPSAENMAPSDFLVFLSTDESPDGRDGKLRGVVKAAVKHLGELGLGAPLFGSAQDIISSDDKFLSVVAALCRAKVVIFDATFFEPAIMLLVGIRSVVRRGLTILSVGGNYSLGARLFVPFNISDANIVAHSNEQDAQKPSSVDLLVSRIKRGIAEINSPYYLDIPVYDALRRIPADRRGVIAREQGVFLLCPFADDYSKRNLKLLQWAFEDQLNALRAREELEGRPELGVARSFELQSPRLVSQAIYEYIRRVQSCVVDLTTWSPNVLFELGVRLASSSSPTACLIEADYEPWFKDQDYPHRELWKAQCEAILAKFVPPAWRYNARLNWESEPAFGKAYGLFAEFPGSGPVSGAVHAAVQESVDVTVEPAVRPVYRELLDSSDLFAKSRGKPVGLYPGNRRLTDAEETAEFERLLAAWLYLSNRFTEDEIMNDEEKSATARDLAIRLVNRPAMREQMPDRVKTLLEPVRRFIKRPEKKS